MGNQNSVHEYQHKVRYRTVDSHKASRNQPRSINNSFELRSRVNNSFEHGSKVNNSFATPPPKSINRSFDQKSSFVNQQQSHVTLQPITKKKQNRFQSGFELQEYQPSRRSTPARNYNSNDKVLQSLSKKNQALRLQLKKINDELGNQLKKKKLVPKRVKQSSKDDEEDPQTIKKKNMGIKRELQNGYKQIQMYKRTIQNLKGREEGDTSQYRLRILEGNVADMDKEIQRYIKRIQGVKKIKNKQQLQIQKDINDDLKEGVETYKHQAQTLKKKLKDYAARDRMRQGNYKKQQAYQCDLQRKMREVNGQYVPDLKGSSPNKKQYHYQHPQKQRVNPKQFQKVFQEAKSLRTKHQEYYRKIDTLLQAKNRAIDDQNWMKQQIVYKQRIIEALKNKLSGIRNLTKPRKNGLFGYDSAGGSRTDNLSQYEDTPSQIQRQLIEQLNQDQFDIKHLIANIPKPVRKRPQEMSNGYSSSGSSRGDTKKRGKGMIVTNEKAQPKKWGAVSTRIQQRGKHYRQQIAFEDRGHFNGDIQPIIVGINIWVDKNNTILALQAIYLNKKQIRYGAKSAETVSAVTKRFDLQSPDYLKNVSMTIGQQGFVESMTFYSKEGKMGKFGNKRSSDQQINFGLASNQRPFLFLGASTVYEAQPRLNMIGIEICSD